MEITINADGAPVQDDLSCCDCHWGVKVITGVVSMCLIGGITVGIIYSLENE